MGLVLSYLPWISDPLAIFGIISAFLVGWFIVAVVQHLKWRRSLGDRGVSAIDYASQLAYELIVTQAERQRAQEACEKMGTRIAELEDVLWYLIGDVEAAHRSHIPAPGDPPITDKEIANLLRAQSLLANYRPT